MNAETKRMPELTMTEVWVSADGLEVKYLDGWLSVEQALELAHEVSSDVSTNHYDYDYEMRFAGEFYIVLTRIHSDDLYDLEYND